MPAQLVQVTGQCSRYIYLCKTHTEDRNPMKIVSENVDFILNVNLLLSFFLFYFLFYFVYSFCINFEL